MLLFHENRMTLGSVAPPVLCRAPLWATPPSSAWFAPRQVPQTTVMNDIGDFCRAPTSPQSDSDSSHSSTDSREVLHYSQYETSPDDYGRPHITASAADSTVPATCMWKGCNRSFNQLDNLSAHVAAEHAVVDGGLFYCGWQGCSRGHRGFNARYKMLVHVRTHTKERPHSCQICGKSFSRAENLKIHARSHSGEKPYVCSVPGCGKAYSNSSDRFKHTRTHMVEKPYCCKIPGCQKRYTDPSSLRKHVKTFKHTNVTSEITNNQKELRNGNTDALANIPDIARQHEFYNKYDKLTTISKTVSESEVYEQQRHKEYTRKYSYSENDCYISDNVYKMNLEAATKLNGSHTSYYESDEAEYRNKIVTPNYNSSIEDDDDERNKLCFCKDLPCVHTSRYVQPEYLTVEPLSYNKIEESTSPFPQTNFKKSFMDEPLNLKRRFFENDYNGEVINLEKKSKTDYHASIVMDECVETPLDLSNKTFF